MPLKNVNIPRFIFERPICDMILNPEKFADIEEHNVSKLFMPVVDKLQNITFVHEQAFEHGIVSFGLYIFCIFIYWVKFPSLKENHSKDFFRSYRHRVRDYTESVFQIPY